MQIERELLSFLYSIFCYSGICVWQAVSHCPLQSRTRPIDLCIHFFHAFGSAENSRLQLTEISFLSFIELSVQNTDYEMIVIES